jgi:hypothetical protein
VLARDERRRRSDERCGHVENRQLREEHERHEIKTTASLELTVFRYEEANLIINITT